MCLASLQMQVAGRRYALTGTTAASSAAGASSSTWAFAFLAAAEPLPVLVVTTCRSKHAPLLSTTPVHKHATATQFDGPGSLRAECTTAVEQQSMRFTHSLTPLRSKAPAITALSFTIDIAFSNSTYLQAPIRKGVRIDTSTTDKLWHARLSLSSWYIDKQ